MELNFAKDRFTCLDPVVREIQNSEQTQQISLPDGLADIGRILAAWGQPILRGKEWRGDSISFSGGMMVWVLYAPEDGSAEQCLEAWIPFQMKWDLPDNVPEGKIRIRCLNRFVDARSVSARKIMIRAGMAALAEAFSPREEEIYTPDKVPGDVQLLRSSYPIRLAKEAGEKTFLMDEELTLPDSAPVPEKLICYRLNPVLADKKVLSNKVVFRGNGNLHVLYRSREGQLHSWDFTLPFSQYSELDMEHGTDAQADIQLMPTSLELELDEGGHLRFKGGIVGQFLITDKQLMELIEDAYSPSRELALQTQPLELPAILDTRRETLYGEQTIPAEGNVAADVTFLPDFPRQRRGENAVELEVPGTFQVLYYGEDGALHGVSSRWEGKQIVSADENSQILAVPVLVEEAQTMVGSGNMVVKSELPLELTATARQEIPMVTGLELGEQRRLDPNRPSLILRRIGEDRLWDIAKASNSTVEAIRKANGLQEEPAPNQMLLIPVG